MTTHAITPQLGEGQRIAPPESSPGEWPLAPESSGPSATPDWRQILIAIDARVAGFEARVERATAEFEAVALARLHQSFGEAIRHSKERVKYYAEACGHSRLVDLEAELERRLEPFLNRSQAATTDLERLLETLRQEQTAWEARIVQREQRAGTRPIQDLVAFRLQRLSESLRHEGLCATGPDGAADAG